MFLVFLSLAFAGDCREVVSVPLATTVSGTGYRTHDVDVVAYAEAHRIGLKDYAPLVVDAGDGDLCYDFGSIRPFEQAMGETGIVVTSGTTQVVRLNTNYNEFWVTGLSVGDTVRIEFIQPYSVKPKACVREEVTSRSVVLNDGHMVHPVFYRCETETMTWRVVEERTFVMVAPG